MAQIDGVRWQEISAQLDELLEVDAAQRAQRLSQLELSDPVLARSVARLLSHQRAIESEHFLEGSLIRHWLT